MREQPLFACRTIARKRLPCRRARQSTVFTCGRASPVAKQGGATVIAFRRETRKAQTAGCTRPSTISGIRKNTSAVVAAETMINGASCSLKTC